MREQRRSHFFLAFAVAFVSILLVQSDAGAKQAFRLPEEVKNDAELTDVTFLDGNRGFAVGDHGVILHTQDGGRHWQRLKTPVTCRLESIHFVDAFTGWIVGGYAMPYTHKSRGVVLRTRDGGQHWSVISDRTLPTLKKVQFFDARRGVAIGNGSSLYDSGVFRTEDSGRSWSALPVGERLSWTTADFRSPTLGIVGGADGRVFTVASNHLKAQQSLNPPHHTIRSIKTGTRNDVWIVGEHGKVQWSHDGGVRWAIPNQHFPEKLAEYFDFETVAVVGDHCWIAGSPGTRIFHSPDRGESWEVLTTESHLPIHALTFVDAKRGWAVGSLGMILATQDGGRTWQPQHRGRSRVALLGLLVNPADIPLELFAQVSGEYGYRSAVESLLDQFEIQAETSTADRMRQALAEMGVATSHTNKTPSIAGNLLPTGLDQSSSLLEEYFVRKIRQWRPEIILTQQERVDEHIISPSVLSIILSAAKKASDPRSYTEHVSQVGLAPWKVRKVMGSCATTKADVTVATSQLATRIGRSLDQHATLARGLLNRDFQPAPSSLGFKVLLNNLPQRGQEKQFFSGILIQPNSETRRPLGAPKGDMKHLNRVTQARRNVERILQSGFIQLGASWIAQMEDLTAGLDEESSGAILFQLGQQFVESDQRELAIEPLELLIQRYPEHPLAQAATTWLVREVCSSEVAWQHRQQGNVGTLVVQHKQSNPTNLMTIRELNSSSESRILRQRLERPRTDNHGLTSPNTPHSYSMEQRLDRTAELEATIRHNDPALYAEPSIRFPLAAFRRQAAAHYEKDAFLHLWSRKSLGNPWQSCARSEEWLTNRTRNSPKPVYQCSLSTSKPYLDGRLNDEIWSTAKSIELQHGHLPGRSFVAMTRDAEFFYLAVVCRKLTGVTYQPSKQTRSRDAKLTEQDHINIFIDIDRDYASFYQFSVDHRGWTREAICDDLHFDPDWFVAASSDQQTWTVEAAIPIDQITGRAPTSGDTWALAIQRVMPKHGVESWTNKESALFIPEMAGLLIFD